MKVNYCRNCGSVPKEHDKICSDCGFHYLNGQAYCQECGVDTKPEQVLCIQCGFKLIHKKKHEKDYKVSFFFGAIGFLIPLLGMIVYLFVYKKEPDKAKSILVGSVIGFLYKLFRPFFYAFLAMVATVFS